MAESITIKDIYTEVKKMESNMVTKKELNQLLETVEILSNPKTISQIKKSEAEILSGKLKQVNSVKDIL